MQECLPSVPIVRSPRKVGVQPIGTSKVEVNVRNENPSFEIVSFFLENGFCLIQYASPHDRLCGSQTNFVQR